MNILRFKQQVLGHVYREGGGGDGGSADTTQSATDNTQAAATADNTPAAGVVTSPDQSSAETARLAAQSTGDAGLGNVSSGASDPSGFSFSSFLSLASPLAAVFAPALAPVMSIANIVNGLSGGQTLGEAAQNALTSFAVGKLMAPAGAALNSATNGGYGTAMAANNLSGALGGPTVSNPVSTVSSELRSGINGSLNGTNPASEFAPSTPAPGIQLASSGSGLTPAMVAATNAAYPQKSMLATSPQGTPMTASSPTAMASGAPASVGSTDPSLINTLTAALGGAASGVGGAVNGLSNTQLMGILGSLYSGSNAAGATNSAGNTLAAGYNAAGSTLASSLAPYTSTGAQAEGQLASAIAPGGSLNTPFTMADATNSSAEQVAQQRGQQAIQNSAAAKGGLVSSNDLQGLNTFAADTGAQYQNQAYQQWLQQQQQQFSQLQGVANAGQSAATTVGTGVGNSQVGAAGAQAGATLGAANATNSGIANAIKSTTALPGSTTGNVLGNLLTGASSTPVGSTTTADPNSTPYSTGVSGNNGAYASWSPGQTSIAAADPNAAAPIPMSSADPNAGMVYDPNAQL